MVSTLIEKVFQAHQTPKALPGTGEIDDFLSRLTQFLYPELNNIRLDTEAAVEKELNGLTADFENLLSHTIACDPSHHQSKCQAFFNGLSEVVDRGQEDMKAIWLGDPAAVDEKEVVRAYPGFYAIAVYRIAHLMLNLDIPYLPRILTEAAHARTGIDIHPAAKIGHHFCIDHGTGVVIGETTEIGDFVKIYQGVTLGALSVRKELAKTKRHPTIEDHVVIYAGATILGGETIIGHHSMIGGNVWITDSIPPRSQVYYTSKGQYVKEILAP